MTERDEEFLRKLDYQLGEISPDVEMTEKTVCFKAKKLLAADEFLRNR